jgi:hypothetical protein
VLPVVCGEDDCVVFFGVLLLHFVESLKEIFQVRISCSNDSTCTFVPRAKVRVRKPIMFAVVLMVLNKVL